MTLIGCGSFLQRANGVNLSNASEKQLSKYEIMRARIHQMYKITGIAFWRFT